MAFGYSRLYRQPKAIHNPAFVTLRILPRWALCYGITVRGADAAPPNRTLAPTYHPQWRREALLALMRNLDTRDWFESASGLK